MRVTNCKRHLRGSNVNRPVYLKTEIRARQDHKKSDDKIKLLGALPFHTMHDHF